MSKPIPLKELIALDNELPEPDGSLRCGVADTEIAIEKLLSEARRLVVEGRDKGVNWWWLVANMLVVDGLTHLAEDLLPNHAEDAGSRWAGELSEWKGDFEVFHEIWMAVLQLRQTDQSIKASESGRKGGKGARKHEIKDHVIHWFSKDGYKIRNSKSAAIDYLLNHWEDFCKDYGIPLEVDAPAPQTIHRYLNGLPHSAD